MKNTISNAATNLQAARNRSYFDQQPPQTSAYNASAAYGSDQPYKYSRTLALEDEQPSWEKSIKKGAKQVERAIKKTFDEPSRAWSQVQAELHQARAELNQQRAALGPLQAERDHFSRLAKSFEQELDACQNDLVREKERIAQMERSTNQLQLAMESREWFLGQQVNDDEVIADFDNLLNDIRTWSTSFGGDGASSFKQDTFSDYQKVVPMCRELHHLEIVATDKKKRRLFVRGWTAYIICTKLWRNIDMEFGDGLGEDVWLDKELADSFSYLENELCSAGEHSIVGCMRLVLIGQIVTQYPLNLSTTGEHSLPSFWVKRQRLRARSQRRKYAQLSRKLYLRYWTL